MSSYKSSPSCLDDSNESVSVFVTLWSIPATSRPRLPSTRLPLKMLYNFKLDNVSLTLQNHVELTLHKIAQQYLTERREVLFDQHQILFPNRLVEPL